MATPTQQVEDENIFLNSKYNEEDAGTLLEEFHAHHRAESDDLKESKSFSDAEILNFSRLDRVRHLLTRVLYSKVYFVLYFLVIGLSLFLLVWNFVKFWDHPRDLWYILLEGFVTFSLVIDVLARMLMEGVRYFKQVLNWIDMLLTLVCIAFFILYLVSVHGSLSEQLGQNFDVVIIVLRFVAQVPRIILFIRNQRKRQLVNANQYIDLGPLGTSSASSLDFTLERASQDQKNLDTPVHLEDQDRKNYSVLV